MHNLRIADSLSCSHRFSIDIIISISIFYGSLKG